MNVIVLCFVVVMYLFGRVKGADFVAVEWLLYFWGEDKIWVVVVFACFDVCGFINVEKLGSWMLVILELWVFNGLFGYQSGIRIVCSYLM